jgi:hypothetical protein
MLVLSVLLMALVRLPVLRCILIDRLLALRRTAKEVVVVA